MVIGQAPPLQKQEVPYDTTMLYEWFEDCGISKEEAQKRFEFDAVYNQFPGKDGSGHKKPTTEQMDSYWSTLETKIQGVDKVIVLGNVAKDYIESKPRTWSCNLEMLFLMHPSRMNYNRYKSNPDKILKPLKQFLNER